MEHESTVQQEVVFTDKPFDLLWTVATIYADARELRRTIIPNEPIEVRNRMTGQIFTLRVANVEETSIPHTFKVTGATVILIEKGLKNLQNDQDYDLLS